MSAAKPSMEVSPEVARSHSLWGFPGRQFSASTALAGAAQEAAAGRGARTAAAARAARAAHRARVRPDFFTPSTLMPAKSLARDAAKVHSGVVGKLCGADEEAYPGRMRVLNWGAAAATLERKGQRQAVGHA